MAQVTITTDAAQDARLAPAFGDFLGLTQPGTNLLQNATTAQVKAAIIAWMDSVVRNYERKVATKAIAEPSAFTPT